VARDTTAGPSRRILVVDDNHDVARSLELGLELLGHTVEIAHDAGEALQLVETFPAEIAIIDIELPTLDGYQLAARLCERNAIRVITVSGHSSEPDPARARRIGIIGHVVKPIDLYAIQRLVSS
jgi:DNA-binding response OmpR family regulator